MAIKKGWAVGDERGPDAFFEGASFVEALGEAERFYPKHTYIEFQGDLATLDDTLGKSALPNLARERADKMPEAALRASGLGKTVDGKTVSRVDFDRAMSMSVSEAYDRLYPIFRYKYDSGPYAGKYVKAFDDLAGMQESFLTENYKLAKGQKPPAGVPRGLSAGPNLLPHKLAGEYSKKKLPMTGLGLCVGSNRACRETCLVYSGRNPVADKDGKAKLVRTEALLLEPEAWVRMWVAAIEKHVRKAWRQDSIPFIRPNVLSDIPWELVCPEIFDYFERRELDGRMRKTGLRFYDYTKVPKRDVKHLNYDLTFSFSGDNEAWCLGELKRGHRVAVVYWLRDPKDAVTRKRWNGYRVIDGDRHDMRPLDPDDVVVGLTYKVSFRSGGAGDLVRIAEPPKFARKFITETFYDTDTGDMMVAATPLDLGAESASDGYGRPNHVATKP